MHLSSVISSIFLRVLGRVHINEDPRFETCETSNNCGIMGYYEDILIHNCDLGYNFKKYRIGTISPKTFKKFSASY